MCENELGSPIAKSVYTAFPRKLTDRRALQTERSSKNVSITAQYPINGRKFTLWKLCKCDLFFFGFRYVTAVRAGKLSEVDFSIEEGLRALRL